MRNLQKILVVKPEGKRPLGKSRHRWESNIRINVKEIGWYGVDWIRPVPDGDQWRAVVNTIMDLRVPQRGWGILRLLSECPLLKKDSAPWSLLISFTVSADGHGKIVDCVECVLNTFR